MLSVTVKLLITSIISFALGWLTKALVNNNNRKEIKLAEELQETKNELHNYQIEISNYFEHTANLFNNLSLQYKNLYDHLADSAKKLCKNELSTSSHLLKHEHTPNWQKFTADQEPNHNWHPTYFEARDAKVNEFNKQNPDTYTPEPTELKKSHTVNVSQQDQKSAVKVVTNDAETSTTE